MKRFFERPPPGVDAAELSGLHIVIEGPDASGRSTHIALLTEWLEQRGYPVATTELSSSRLVEEELEAAKQGNLLSPRTMSLFYATDFYDQLENIVIPALRAGSIVLSDRYLYTLMARDLVRGGDMDWLRSLYSMAVVPDQVYYFSVDRATLIERTFAYPARLNYWQSGMDMGLSRDWYDSLVLYQKRMRTAFRRLDEEYGFETVDANRRLATIQQDLRDRIDGIVEERYSPAADRAPLLRLRSTSGQTPTRGPKAPVLPIHRARRGELPETSR